MEDSAGFCAMGTPALPLRVALTLSRQFTLSGVRQRRCWHMARLCLGDVFLSGLMLLMQIELFTAQSTLPPPAQ
jgi:hypothetical protein